MNTTHGLENNSTSCDTAALLMYLLPLLFHLKNKQKSDYLPDQKALTEQINQAKICVKQALKKYNPKN